MRYYIHTETGGVEGPLFPGAIKSRSWPEDAHICMEGTEDWLPYREHVWQADLPGPLGPAPVRHYQAPPPRATFPARQIVRGSFRIATLGISVLLLLAVMGIFILLFLALA